MVTPMPDRTETVTRGRREHAVTDGLLPARARELLLDAVLTAFASAGVDGFVVRGATTPGPTVGVRAEQRDAALRALAGALPGPGMYLQESYGGPLSQPVVPLSADSIGRVPQRCPALHVARLWSVAGGLLSYGMEHGCRVEFWSVGAEGPDMYSAPIPNVAGQHFHRDYLAPARITVEGRERPSIELFDRLFLDDVDFPIDVVYTWVDGDDPAWRERMLRARADMRGTAYHPEAQAANRYQSRDELRYSLRSLEMYAPWVRHVYLVTDRQVPTWLAPSDRLTVVDHRDIFTDPSVLPVFNSSAIISQLHHIEGLSEHYLYFNDDVFLGADARPADFWHGSGIAKVFPSTKPRAFGRARHEDAPHFNISKNIRLALEESVGRSVSYATQHTPYPQIRSVNYEIEQRFADVVDGTARQRFRHHDDIALDQLFHYYAQATGRAVPATLPYFYVNVGDAASIVKLRRLLAARDGTLFCLNDAPEPGRDPIPAQDVAAFLDAYFPIPASFER